MVFDLMLDADILFLHKYVIESDGIHSWLLQLGKENNGTIIILQLKAVLV